MPVCMESLCECVCARAKRNTKIAFGQTNRQFVLFFHLLLRSPYTALYNYPLFLHGFNEESARALAPNRSNTEAI